MKNRKEEYKDLSGTIDYLTNEVELTGEEKLLLSELKNIISLDQSKKVIEKSFKDDYRLAGLYDMIERKIEFYNSRLLILKSFHYMKGYEPWNIDVKELKSKIEKLEELRFNLISFSPNSLLDNTRTIQWVIEKCVYALAVDYFTLPEFFGRSIAKRDKNSLSKNYNKFIIDDEVIDRIYDLLSDSDFMIKLKDGVAIYDKERQLSNEFGFCYEANENKNLIYSNIDDIITYNKLMDEISSLYREIDEKYDNLNVKLAMITRKINKLEDNVLKKVTSKKQIEELKHRRDALVEELNKKSNLISRRDKLIVKTKELEKKFAACGLGDILLRGNVEGLLNTSHSEMSIISKIRTFHSKEEIDSYFKQIDETLLENATKVDEALDKKNKYRENTRKDVLDLLDNQFTTAVNLVNLCNSDKRYDVSPVIALFTLKALVVLNNTQLGEMGLSLEEQKEIEDSYYSLVSNRIQGYEDQFYNICDDSSNKVHKKNK
jgi:hypothetical protein